MISIQCILFLWKPIFMRKIKYVIISLLNLDFCLSGDVLELTYHRNYFNVLNFK